MKSPAPIDWLDNEDRVCRKDRAVRLDWLANLAPNRQYLTFPGGRLTKQLYEEARYCFVYAQFLASITLGMAYIERTLAALLYGAGRSDLEKANVTVLMRVAVEVGWITGPELADIEHAKSLRNKVMHFRRPLAEGSIEHRSIGQKAEPFSILEQDAQRVLQIVLHLVDKNAA